MTRFPVFPTASSAVHRRTALVVAQSGTHEELVARWAGSGPGPRDLRHLNCRARNATRRRAARFGHEHGRSMPGEEAHCWAASRARRRAVRDVKRSTRRWVAGWSSGRSRAGRAAGQVPRSTRLEAPQLPGTIARRRGLEGRGERRAARFGHEHGRSMPDEEAHCWAASRARSRAVRDVKRSTKRWVEEQSLARWAGSGSGTTPPHRSTTLEAPRLPSIELDRALEGPGELRRAQHPARA